jgi:tRNA-specific adenosine deaminase 1
MELIMSAQPDSTPWPLRSQDEDSLLGRRSFSQLGVVRRKPARGDAPRCDSKSCSDKLALKQVCSILSSCLACLIDIDEEAYIKTLILPKEKISEPACERAFGISGRMKPILGLKLPEGYRYRPFEILPTKERFPYSRLEEKVEAGEKYVASNHAAIWTPNFQEILINHVLQGKRATDISAPSRISRLRLYEELIKLQQQLSAEGREGIESDYESFKQSESLSDYLAVKQLVRLSSLKPWIQNGSDSFRLISNIVSET